MHYSLVLYLVWLSGLLEYHLLHFIYGEFSWLLFTNYIGDQTIFLIAFGVIMAYVGNVYMKESLNCFLINFFGYWLFQYHYLFFFKFYMDFWVNHIIILYMSFNIFYIIVYSTRFLPFELLIHTCWIKHLICWIVKILI